MNIFGPPISKYITSLPLLLSSLATSTCRFNCKIRCFLSENRLQSSEVWVTSEVCSSRKYKPLFVLLISVGTCIINTQRLFAVRRDGPVELALARRCDEPNYTVYMPSAWINQSFAVEITIRILDAVQYSCDILIFASKLVWQIWTLTKYYLINQTVDSLRRRELFFYLSRNQHTSKSIWSTVFFLVPPNSQHIFIIYLLLI